MRTPVLQLLEAVLAGIEGGQPHSAIGRTLGLSRSRVTNLARLRALPSSVLQSVRAGRLTPKHAEALVGLSAGRVEQLWVAAVAGDWSVEQLRLATQGSEAPRVDPDTRRLESRLSELLATEVRVCPTPDGGGHLQIRYFSNDTLDGLLERLGYAAE